MFRFLKFGNYALSLVQLLMIKGVVQIKSELNLDFPLRVKEKSGSSCRPLTHRPSYLKQGDLISHSAMRRASGLINYHY